MRLALACLALLAVGASSRGGCGKLEPPYEPCAGRACGTACTVCDPHDPSCVETAEAKACDPGGGCVPAGTFACPPAATGACAGKACGDPCTVEPPCRSATPPCLAPTLLGHCDPTGQCVAADVSCVPPPPPDPCAGKACHEACSICPPGAGDCAAIACVTWCDGQGRCTCAGGGEACK